MSIKLEFRLVNTETNTYESWEQHPINLEKDCSFDKFKKEMDLFFKNLQEETSYIFKYLKQDFRKQC
jgi:hypothetical protein